jgi:8-oxo-dGTP pyrophosphatase MutT (NUDIX family)
MPEPGKFFVGLIDFFAVWLPGALLVYLLKDPAAAAVLPPHIAEQLKLLDNTEEWVVFLFASYVAGQFLFLLGSLLDEWLYDRLRSGTADGQIRRLAGGARLSARLSRELGSRLFNNDDKALRQILRIKALHLDAVGASSAVNAFQWCKARLALNHPEVMAEVQRYEADSKFFRSLFVVLILLVLWLPARGGAWPAATGLGFWLTPAAAAIGLALCFWRYAERRGKSIEQAYWFVISDYHAAAAEAEPPAGRADELTHGAGVVLRYSDERGHEYLRVKSNKTEQWVLPKGHIEPWEEPAETAVREVLEETGCWARVVDRLADLNFSTDGESVRSACFMMEYLERRPDSPFQLHPWLPAPLPKNDEPRACEWRRLRHCVDLAAESRDAVIEAAKRLSAHPYTGRRAASDRASALGRVSSIQPPPSTREPS